MHRELRIARMLLAGTAVALTGTLYAAFGWTDAAFLAAIVVVLSGLYRLRRFARRALVYGGRPRTDDVVARTSAMPTGHPPLALRRLPSVGS
jgi:hypothetical protein